MNILVTGGAGYIGSHTCKALAKAGYTPITFDNLIYGHKWAVKWGVLEIGDINDKRRLKEVLEKYNPIAVIHFAAFAYVGESVKEPAKYYQNNVCGTLTLLEAMQEKGIKRIVFSSTCATYGIPKTIPITEQMPQTPINPYGHSKLMIEQILRDYHQAYDIRSISLRYFNAAGADIDCEIGEAHDPETHLIPLVLQAAAGIRSSITIFGDDYDTHDGTCIRDYIHVTDLADAHVKALTALSKESSSTALNLGTGQGYSIREVIEMVEKVTGRKVPYTIGARRLGDPACLVSDAKKANSVLAWKPQHSKLEPIIRSAWQWLQHHQA